MTQEQSVEGWAGRVRVLLVEDDPGEVRLLQAGLRSAEGVRLDLQVVDTLAGAIAALDSHELDVVLLDLSLPDSQGLDTVTRLLAAHGDVPVVVLTGITDEALASAAMQAGAQDYFVKGSVPPKVLARVVRHARERHALQQGLELREHRFRAMAEAAQDAIYRFRSRPGFAFEYLNPAVARISGFPLEQFYDDPSLYVDRLHPEDRSKLSIEGLSASGDSRIARVRFQRADGEWLVLEDNRTAVVEHGAVVGVQGVVRDVSAQQRTTQALQDALHSEHQAAAQLRATNELKSQFLQAVSHELRTPLTSIIGFARTMVDSGDRLVAGQFTQFSERILDNAQRLQVLMGDLLDLEQLTHTGMQVRRVQTDVTALARRVAQDLVLGGRRCLVDDEACAALVDPAMVERILRNLLGNAAKHTPPDTTIGVRCHLDEGTVTITVADDGPGVPDHLREQVFEPFWQGEAMRQSASPGTGVGLSVVRQFAALHHGHAWLAPTSGCGTTVHVELGAAVWSGRGAPADDGLVPALDEASPAPDFDWPHLGADDRRALQRAMDGLLHAVDAATATDVLVGHLRACGADVVADAGAIDLDATICLDPDVAALAVIYPDDATRRILDVQLSFLVDFARYALATSGQRPRSDGHPPGARPTARGDADASSPAEVDAVAAPRDDAATVMLWATRELLASESVEELVGIVLRATQALGGAVLPAHLADDRALPLDLTLGTGEPLLPGAEPRSVARMQLERHLPGLVADARRAADRLRASGMPDTDPTSGLMTGQEFQRPLSRVGERDVVVAVDLDDLHELTDAYGQAAGEEVVRRFATCLREQLRAGDRAARVGHGEFALLLRGAGRRGAETVLERLRGRWHQVRPYSMAFSADVAVGGEHGPEATHTEQLLRLARRAGRHAWQVDVDEGSAEEVRA